MERENTLNRKENKIETKQEKSYSVIRAFYGMTILVAAVLIINVVMGFFTIVDMRDHNKEVIEQTLSDYQVKQEARFSSAKHFVEWAAVNETLITDLRSHLGDALVSKDLNKIRARVNEMKYTFGDGFMFFISMNEGRRFYTVSALATGYSDYVGLKNALIEESISGDKDLRWKTYFPENGKSPFLFYGITYNHVYMACAINADYLEGSLNSIELGQLGRITYSDIDGNLLYATTGEGGSSFSYFYDDFEISSRKEGLPYSVNVYTDVYTSLVEQQLRQYILLFVFLLVIGVSISFLRRIYIGILQPLENFENAMQNADNEDSLITLESNSVKELEAASNQLKLLVNQIRDMRISIYEEELEKRKQKITFLQSQIKPHFYLNCLSTIDSMIQLGKYDEAQEMLLFTSKYIRYLFQAGRDFVRLEYELSHIDAYLDIQNMRMNNPFEYTKDVDNDACDASIPPLLIITFVENCVKHALPAAGEKLKIYLRARHVIGEDHGDGPFGRDRLVIDIVDSGMGFSENLLELYNNELNSTQITAANAEIIPASTPGLGSGNHIGIVNSIQRLKLIYGNDFKLTFSNDDSSLKGAHISLELPWNEEASI